MVRIPKRLAALETPINRSLNSRGSSQSADSIELRQTIQAASSAYAAVALEDALSEMPGIAAQPPFLDAPVGTERLAAGWHFETTPTAQTSAVCSFRKRIAIRPTACQLSLDAHANRIQPKCFGIRVPFD